MTEKQPLIPLPLELPPAFAEQLGYSRDRRFVAAYWEPLGDEVTIRDDSFSACGLSDWYPWTTFFHQPELIKWKLANQINLGNSDEPATYWLIIDRHTNQGFVAPVTEAYNRVQQQRLINVE